MHPYVSFQVLATLRTITWVSHAAAAAEAVVSEPELTLPSVAWREEVEVVMGVVVVVVVVVVDPRHLPPLLDFQGCHSAPWSSIVHSQSARDPRESGLLRHHVSVAKCVCVCVCVCVCGGSVIVCLVSHLWLVCVCMCVCVFFFNHELCVLPNFYCYYYHYDYMYS